MARSSGKIEYTTVQCCIQPPAMELEMVQVARAAAPPRRHHLKGSCVSGLKRWAAAICLTLFILGAMCLLILVFLLRPHAPFMDVQAASLEKLRYDKPGGTLTARVSLHLEARNRNPMSSATFNDVQCRVALAGAALALVGVEPFTVPAKAVQRLDFVAAAENAALDDAETDILEAALNNDVVPFRVSGETRTSWRFLGIVKMKKWRRWTCELEFIWSNGTALPFSCTSKPNFPSF